MSQSLPRGIRWIPLFGLFLPLFGCGPATEEAPLDGTMEDGGATYDFVGEFAFADRWHEIDSIETRDFEARKYLTKGWALPYIGPKHDRLPSDSTESRVTMLLREATDRRLAFSAKVRQREKIGSPPVETFTEAE